MLNPSPLANTRKPKQSRKSLDKSNASNSTNKKRPTSSSKKTKNKDHNNVSVVQNFVNDSKKKTSKGLTKKKIEDIKAPDLIIKASYKGKKLSIPLNSVENKGLEEIMTPYMVRF